MSTTELVETIRKAGGVLTLDGDGIECDLPPDTAHLLPLLRERKPEVIAILQVHGGRMAAFPHCPRCASYDLYRRDNLGTYQCESCGLVDIPEDVARRLN